ncbi:metal-dependent hydrolase [Cohnella hongkongensis]|uniref:Metal-dependent hydrolase n=1 Tax=Cohnella hongkongensis TaxID=178337 RepID=A0ABV9F7I0_9BACL
MDTGSHLLFGVTLAGTSLFWPSVAADAQLAAAVLTASVAGSLAPDFDAVVRLKGKDAYLKHHRGISHALPVWPVWAGMVAALSSWLWGAGEHALLLLGFALAAVALHVLFDWTNAYGVQFLLPFRREWLHLDAVCLTDPFLLAVHAAAVATALFGGAFPAPWAFAGAWAVTAAYVAWRIVHHAIVVRRVRRRYRRALAVHVLPGLWWFRWQFLVQTGEGYEMGSIDGRRWLPCKHLPPGASHECIEASQRSSSVQTLRGFAKRAYASWREAENGDYLVTWTDLRFWRPKDWPYRAEVRLDRQLNVVAEEIGWHKKAWEAPYV